MAAFTAVIAPVPEEPAYIVSEHPGDTVLAPDVRMGKTKGVLYPDQGSQ